MVY
ncbi:MAG: hypothetical protein RLZZ289_536, partial [Bacteroidota bacterium]|jgi:hypothetical protein